MIRVLLLVFENYFTVQLGRVWCSLQLFVANYFQMTSSMNILRLGFVNFSRMAISISSVLTVRGLPRHP